MRHSSRWLRIIAPLVSAIVLLGAVERGGASSDNLTNWVLTPLDATQKLADSLKNNLFTPEQIEQVRHSMLDLESLLAKSP